MNSFAKHPTARVTLFLICLLTGAILKAQDAEKQKIIDVINTELETFMKKDHDKWANTWVHSDKAMMFTADAFGYFFKKGYDSLDASRIKWWTSPVIPTYGEKKSDFDVNIKGSIAIVNLKATYSDNTIAYQNIIMEKTKTGWKVFQMISFSPDTYKSTDQNVEIGINWQGYQLLNMKKVDEAIQVFTLNTQLYPKAWNTWDSLAEAYMVKGEKEIAIAFYKKSISLNDKNENGKKQIQLLSQN